MNEGLLKQVYNDNDEDSSEEWERIKNFVGGANKPSKHPLEQELERTKMRNPQHYAEGGEAGFDLMGDLTGGSSDQLKLNGIPSPIVPNPIVPRGTIPTPSPVEPNPVAPSLPPATTPPTTVTTGPSSESYDTKASDILGGVTPEKISELMNTLNERANKSQIGAGIAGIGDAIASVGGQNPGHMKATEENIQKQKELGLKLPVQMAEVGKERFGLAQELQARDPNSPFSKVVQNANRQILKSMGASDEDVSSMPATAINDVVGHQVTLQEALARIKQEGAYQQGMLENTKLGTQNTIENQRREREQEAQRIKAEAAKTLTSQGLINRLTHPGATKALETTAGIGTTPTGPLGPTTVRNGKTYEWSPSTGKYHLKQGQ